MWRSLETFFSTRNFNTCGEWQLLTLLDVLPLYRADYEEALKEKKIQLNITTWYTDNFTQLIRLMWKTQVLWFHRSEPCFMGFWNPLFLFVSPGSPRPMQELEPSPGTNGEAIDKSRYQKRNREWDGRVQYCVLPRKWLRFVQSWTSSTRKAFVWTERLRPATPSKRLRSKAWVWLQRIQGKRQRITYIHITRACINPKPTATTTTSPCITTATTTTTTTTASSTTSTSTTTLLLVLLHYY